MDSSLSIKPQGALIACYAAYKALYTMLDPLGLGCNGMDSSARWGQTGNSFQILQGSFDAMEEVDGFLVVIRSAPGVFQSLTGLHNESDG